MSGRLSSNGALVRGHAEYKKQLQLVRDMRAGGDERLADEAFRILTQEELEDSYTPEKWMHKRAHSIATVIRESESGSKMDEGRAFARLVYGYVIIDNMCKKGTPPTLAWLKEKRKLRETSKQWLQESNDLRLKARERKEQLKPRSDRRPAADLPNTGFPKCARVGCLNTTGEQAEGGKVRKTNFIVGDVETGREMKVCRSCVIQANRQAADPRTPAHISSKDSLCVMLRGESFERFSDMAVARKSRVKDGSEEVRTSLPGTNTSSKDALGFKRQKTIMEAVGAHENDYTQKPEDKGAKQEGTDADPILLSSSDDEELNRKEKLYMAVINPCQRQTRRTSKLEVDTDPVLDKLKCFMPPEGGRGSIKFALRDYFKLRPMEFLNDSCIDYFLKGIEIRLKEELPNAWKRCYFFNSFFYKKLTDNQSVVISEETKALAGMPLGEMDQASLQALRCYDLTKSWTKHVDLFEKDYLFIPICENLHWSLLIVCHPGRGLIKSNTIDPKVPGTFMIHLDSMRSHRAYDIGKLVKMYLQNEWKAKLRQEGDSVAKRWAAKHPGEERDFLRMRLRRPHVPLQDNHFDCGLFLCAFVDHFLACLPKTMNESKVPQKIRKTNILINAIRTRCHFPRVPHFLTSKWFSSENVGNLRTDLALRVVRAMAVNAGVMDNHARWTTHKMLTQEQQHMLTYLMNQEEVLKERKESYSEPEWLEVLTDEEDINDDECAKDDIENASNEDKSGGGVSDDVVVSIDAEDGPPVDCSKETKPGTPRSPKGVELNTNVAANDDYENGRSVSDIVIDNPIEDVIEAQSTPNAMTPRECTALLRKVHEKKRDRNTPSLQAISQQRKGDSIEIIDEPKCQVREPARRPCPALIKPFNKKRGSMLVGHALAKSKGGLRKQ